MTFTFPFYIIFLVVGVSILVFAIGIGIAIFTRMKAVGIGLCVFGTIVGTVLAPGLAMDRVIVDEFKVEQTTGFWFAPTVKGFQIDDVENIVVEYETTEHGLTNEIWAVGFKNGNQERIDLGDLWQMNSHAIKEELVGRGVEITESD